MSSNQSLDPGSCADYCHHRNALTASRYFLATATTGTKTKMSTPVAQSFTFTRKQSASNKTPRQINRNLVFNLIRTRQPISRADLPRVSRLHRSTRSLIAEHLLIDTWQPP